MTDREMVINTLEEIKTQTAEIGLGSAVIAHVFIDKIVTLLEEQNAVVHPEPSCVMKYITDCRCDLCGVQLIREDNFCRCCGKRIEWERSVK